MGDLIDGRAIAEQVHADTARRVAALQARGLQAGLVFVRVGEDPASQVYVGMKARTCARLGVWSETKVLPENTSEAQLLALLESLNADPRVHGILVQAPLPSHLRPALVYSAVRPEKDVDGFHPVNVGPGR
jgi:methylenetetrahydrofolate dehydrogenase (NADP+) / methenyltetrahydrofolate cyclohydrolase